MICTECRFHDFLEKFKEIYNQFYLLVRHISYVVLRVPKRCQTDDRYSDRSGFYYGALPD